MRFRVGALLFQGLLLGACRALGQVYGTSRFMTINWLLQLQGVFL